MYDYLGYHSWDRKDSARAAPVDGVSGLGSGRVISDPLSVSHSPIHAHSPAASRNPSQRRSNTQGTVEHPRVHTTEAQRNTKRWGQFTQKELYHRLHSLESFKTIIRRLVLTFLLFLLSFSFIFLSSPSASSFSYNVFFFSFLLSSFFLFSSSLPLSSFPLSLFLLIFFVILFGFLFSIEVKPTRLCAYSQLLGNYRKTSKR